MTSPVCYCNAMHNVKHEPGIAGCAYYEPPTPNPTIREATGLERTAINSTLAEMHALMERMQARGIHESMMEGLVSSYERILDAVMYGYPAAVIDGWDEPVVEPPTFSVRFRRMLDRVMVGRSQ